jgi:hypothetical protein
MHNNKAFITRGIFFGNIARPVGRTIINTNRRPI